MPYPFEWMPDIRKPAASYAAGNNTRPTTTQPVRHSVVILCSRSHRRLAFLYTAVKSATNSGTLGSPLTASYACWVLRPPLASHPTGNCCVQSTRQAGAAAAVAAQHIDIPWTYARTLPPVQALYTAPPPPSANQPTDTHGKSPHRSCLTS